MQSLHLSVRKPVIPLPNLSICPFHRGSQYYEEQRKERDDAG